MCSHCVSVCDHQSHTDREGLGPSQVAPLMMLVSHLFPVEGGLALAVEAKGGQWEAKCQLKPSGHVFFLDRLTFPKCCLRARTYPGPIPPARPLS